MGIRNVIYVCRPLTCFSILTSNQDVRVPSPLQTTRVRLYESSNDNKALKHTSKPKQTDTQHILATQDVQMQPADENLDVSASKTMYIRNGVVLSKSPVLKKFETSKTRKRTPLSLTRVGVPKKAVRKLPLFNHCLSSIKKTQLPDVTMKPITSSENTSTISSDKSSTNSSLAGDVDLLQHNVFSR